MRPALVLSAAFAFSIAAAQSRRVDPVLPGPTGEVTGHAFCADTNQPARFAKVSLLAVPSAAKSKPAGATNSFRPPVDVSGAGTVQTGLDGSFTFSKVKPGAYYVLVSKEGYLGPRDIFTQEQMEDASPAMLALRAESIPIVKVEAGHAERAEVRLERGASVSGTILYDDGSPASELDVQILHKDADGVWVAPGFNTRPGSWVRTNDLGQFRAASLLPGDYMIEVDLSMSSMKSSSVKGCGDVTMEYDVNAFFFKLPFYGSGTARLSEAKPVHLQAGRDTPGQDMLVPISKLHKVTGRVAAGRDGHFINAAALSLFTREDDVEVAQTTISRDDGLFHFEFIPDGDYSLKIKSARDVVWDPVEPEKNSFSPPTEKERILATFAPGEQPVLVRGDILGITATLTSEPEAKPPSTDATNF